MRISKKVFPKFHLFCNCDWNGKKVEKRGIFLLLKKNRKKSDKKLF